MRNVQFGVMGAAFTVAVAVAVMPACEQKSPTAGGSGSSAPAAAGKASDHGHDHAGGDGHSHGDGHDHGPVTKLGEQSAGGFTIGAEREGAVTPGGEAPVDVQVSAGAGRVSVVRLWIGTKDAKGSVKAKAEPEKSGWHAHVEVPKPLPEESKLWVEVETDKGEKVTVAFDLKG